MAREREIAERFRQPTALWLAQAGKANLAIVAGELETAAALSTEALQLGQQSEPDALACYAAQQASIAHDAGRLGELGPMLQQAVTDTPGVPGFRATLALALVQSGQREAAKEIFDEEAITGFRELPYDVTWLAVVCIYAYVGAKLGDAQASRALYRLLEPWHAQVAFPAFGVWGPVELYLGMLASVVGEAEIAQGHLQRAASAADRAEAPIWKARVQGELAALTESRSE
jgi:tetratricopeptide (TPR) repeat protein